MTVNLRMNHGKGRKHEVSPKNIVQQEIQKFILEITLLYLHYIILQITQRSSALRENFLTIKFYKVRKIVGG